MWCPRCSASLPDGAGSCQFCQAVWAPNASAGPGRPPVAGVQFNRPETWTTKAYFAVAAWWTLSGVWSVLQATAFATEKNDGGGAVAIAFGAISAIIGLGLLLKVEAVRNVVVIMACFNILFGLFGVVMSFFLAPLAGIWGAVIILRQFIDIGLAGLMIFLIGETDTRTPNF